MIRHLSALLTLCVALSWSADAAATCNITCDATPMRADCTTPEVASSPCDGQPATCMPTPSALVYGWVGDEAPAYMVTCSTVCCAPPMMCDPNDPDCDPDAPNCSEPTSEPATANNMMQLMEDNKPIAGAFQAATTTCGAGHFVFERVVPPGTYRIAVDRTLQASIEVTEAPAEDMGGGADMGGSADMGTTTPPAGDTDSDDGCTHTPGAPSPDAPAWPLAIGALLGLAVTRRR